MNVWAASLVGGPCCRSTPLCFYIVLRKESTAGAMRIEVHSIPSCQGGKEEKSILNSVHF